MKIKIKMWGGFVFRHLSPETIKLPYLLQDLGGGSIDSGPKMSSSNDVELHDECQ